MIRPCIRMHRAHGMDTGFARAPDSIHSFLLCHSAIESSVTGTATSPKGRGHRESLISGGDGGRPGWLGCPAKMEPRVGKEGASECKLPTSTITTRSYTHANTFVLPRGIKRSRRLAFEPSFELSKSFETSTRYTHTSLYG